jgi:hypothetical protein
MNQIKTLTIAFSAFLLLANHVQGQSKLGALIKKVTTIKKEPGKTTTTTTTTTTTAAKPTALEIGSGIKEALEVGISRGADLLSAKDGYLGNIAVKILFPPEAQKVEKTLRSLGLGSVADNVITSLNRAAEDAAKEAKPIFVSAIKQMTITNATNILLGNQNSATEYFKKATTAQLMDKFKPVIAGSLEKVGATRYWSTATSQYNKLPMVTRVNTDLSDYATQKAIEGMFIQVAQEELTIRNNIGARSSTLLQKVFGYADKLK